MEKHFYFFRHGQTNENELGKREGLGTGAYLTDLGKCQAQKLSDFLKDKNLDVIYTSPYKRAVDTAEIIASKYKNLDIIPNNALCEIVFGFWGPCDEESKKRMENNYNKIQKFLKKIATSKKYKNIAVSSHGGVTRALCFAAGQKIEGIKNCECFHFLLKDNIFKYIETFDTGINVNNVSDKK